FATWMRQYHSDAPNFELKPELVATWPWAAWAVFYFWSTRNLNDLADRDDLVAITKRINGGTNGLSDRAAYLAKAKDIVAEISADAIAFQPGDTVLRRGMRGLSVADLQRGLRAAGFYHLSIDGI